METTDSLKIFKDIPWDEEYLRMIQEFTQKTASNTAFSFWREADFWEYMAISLSILAIVLSVITAILQWQTERNTRMSLSMKAQVYESILKSLLNDLYRIQCDIISLQIILIENDFRSYPTDRFLKNMMIRFDDSNLDSFLVVFNKKNKSKVEEHYLKMQEINRLTQNYNVSLEMLMEHLKDPSIDKNTKLFDFSVINNNISFLSQKILQTAVFIYGKNSDVTTSLLHYVKKALEYYQEGEINTTSMDCYINLKKYEKIIIPILNDYFEHTNIKSTKDIMLLSYRLISNEIDMKDSDVINSLIDFKV